MSSGPKPVSSASSRRAPAATRSPSSSEPDTHCHRPGRIRPGARRSSRISRARPRRVAGRSSSRRGPGGRSSVDASSRPRSSWSCSRCIRSWTPANSSHSPQRSRPTCGWSSGHGSDSWPTTARVARSTIRWLWAILRRSVSRSASGATRDALDDARGVGRPAIAGGERRRQAQPHPRLAGVADALGDVPVALATRGPQRLLGECLDHRGQRLGHASPAGSSSAGRGPGPGPPADLATDGDELAGLDAAPGRDDIRRTRLQRVDPGEAHRRAPLTAAAGTSRGR